jgi:hypothetical protein
MSTMFVPASAWASVSDTLKWSASVTTAKYVVPAVRPAGRPPPEFVNWTESPVWRPWAVALSVSVAAVAVHDTGAHWRLQS